MKQKSENDSKAGIQKANTNVFKSLFSKSASMLLIAMAGFSMMSFTQDEVVVNNNDTNLNMAKQTTAVAVEINDACCAVQVVKPGDEIKKSLIRMTASPKAVSNADAENFNAFIAEVKERNMWSMNLSEARRNADKEINFNFHLNKLFPEAAAKVAADDVMQHLFDEDIIRMSGVKTTDYVVKADAELSNSFLTEHFSIKMVNAPVKADKEMVSAFERTNLPFIGIPSKSVAAQADAEVKNNYEAALKVITTIAVK